MASLRIHCAVSTPLRAVVAAAIALLGAACRTERVHVEATAERSTLSTERSTAEPTIGPNDVLRVGVYGHPELSAPPHANTATGSRVDPQGNVSLPLIGAVRVGGMTPEDAREAIRVAFARFLQEPKIDLSVVEWSSRRFHLLGEVQRPGGYVLDRPLSIYEGLSFGNGFSSRANRGAIVLVRGTPDALEVHLINGEAPSPEGLAMLEPGDLLFVRRSGAGRFSDEALPILQGVGSALGSAATLLLIDDQLND